MTPTPGTPQSHTAFVLGNTAIMNPPHVGEIALHLADEAHGLWHRTQEELERDGLPPPYWAFAWAGGQGLSRYVLDNRALFAGARVFDLAAGSGIVAIAAAMAGAAGVVANDCDPFAVAAIACNSALNKVKIRIDAGDYLTSGKLLDPLPDYILAGDVYYDRVLAQQVSSWLALHEGFGVRILIGDPGRAYLPKTGLVELARFEVPVSRALEDAEIKDTRVWTMGGR